jgi:hypothetical protein
MKPRWWRGARTRENAGLIIEREDRDSCLWMYPDSMSTQYERANSILKLAKTTDGDSVTLTEEDVKFLFI